MNEQRGLKKTILLVEDEALIAIMEKDMLQKYNYNVIIASSGEKAVKIVQNTPEIDLILMDINLGKGKMDGTEATDNILRERDLPVLFLSSYNQAEIVEKTEKITSYGYVVKDAGITVLDASIKMALKLHKAKGELRDKEIIVRQSEEEYHKLFENAPIGIFHSTPEGRFLKVNPALSVMLGYDSPEEMVSSISDIAGQIYVDSKKRDNLLSDTLQKHGWIFSENRYRRKDGSILIGNLAVRKELNPHGTVRYLEGFIEDITERKQTEILLQKTNADLLERKKELECLHAVSEILRRHTTLTDSLFQEIVSTIPPAFLHPRVACARIRIREKDYFSEQFIETAWGITSPITIHGKEAGNLAVCYREKRQEEDKGPFLDYEIKLIETIAERIGKVIERIEAKADLNLLNERFSLASHAAGMGIWDWDIQKNIITWDDRMHELYGTKKEDFTGAYEAWINGLYPDDAARSFEISQQALRGEKEYDTEFRVLWPSGVVRYLKAHGQVIRDSSGVPLRMIGINYDITEHKQIDNTQQFLLQSDWSGKDFFQSLAYYLAETLDMDFVCIDHLENECLSARTLAVYFDGKFEDNISYTLKDTPCGDVVGKKICSFPRDVRHLFPHDTVLQEMVAEGYMGATLWNLQGQPIGLIALISRKPLTNPSHVETILKMVAFRAAGELERRKGEEQIKSLLAEKDLLLKEVHHRIKNNMTAMISLLSFQADMQKESSPAGILLDAANRLRSMSVLYDKLYRSENFREIPAGDFLVPLVNEIIKTFPVNIRIETEVCIDDFILPVNLLSPLGIIINELITNTIKHAFPGRSNGLITLSVLKKNNHATLIFADNGIGISKMVDIENSEGLGLQLIHLLTKQIDGAVRVERGEGTKFILEFDV